MISGDRRPFENHTSNAFIQTEQFTDITKSEVSIAKSIEFLKICSAMQYNNDGLLCHSNFNGHTVFFLLSDILFLPPTGACRNSQLSASAVVWPGREPQKRLHDSRVRRPPNKCRTRHIRQSETVLPRPSTISPRWCKCSEKRNKPSTLRHIVLLSVGRTIFNCFFFFNSNSFPDRSVSSTRTAAYA